MLLFRRMFFVIGFLVILLTLNSCKHNLNDFTFTLTDKGYSIDRYNGKDSNPYIPSYINGENVFRIGSYAFSENDYIKEINIPDSITDINVGAFENLKNLVKINLPDSVTSIGKDAFSQDKKLTTVNISKNVQMIGSTCFDQDTALTAVNVDPNNLYFSSLDGVLFDKKQTELIEYPEGKTEESYTVPNTVEKIGSYSFRSAKLSAVILSDNVETIDFAGFEYMANLEQVTVSENLTSFGESSFIGCDKLTSFIVNDNNKNYSSIDGVLYNKNQTELVRYPQAKTTDLYTIPDSVQTIGYQAFFSADIKEIEIPISVTEIMSGAFQDSSLSSIHIPDGITTIASDTFRADSKLANVSLPDSIQSIGDNAFGGCNSLTNFTISKNVTSIGTNIFYDALALASIEVDEDNDFYSSEDGVLFNKDQTELLIYPQGKHDSDYIVPNGVVSITDYAFNATHLNNLTLPKSINTIGINTFQTPTMNLTILATTPPNLTGYLSMYNDGKLIIIVQASSLSLYKTDYSWSKYTIISEE